MMSRSLPTPLHSLSCLYLLGHRAMLPVFCQCLCSYMSSNVVLLQMLPTRERSIVALYHRACHLGVRNASFTNTLFTVREFAFGMALCVE